MKRFSRWSIATLAIALLAVGRLQAQPDPNLQPTFGEVTLKAGFLPDPAFKDLVAGGPLKTNLGGVNAHVAKEPDFRLNYTKGTYPLTFSVESKGGTTLLINLPDGTWIADDDSGKGLNSLIRLVKPESGRYDIFLGTVGNNNVNARLLITERTPFVALKGPRPDCYVLSAGVDNYRNANKLNGCLNDARNTMAAFKAQQGTLFRKVESEILLDGTASRGAILEKFRNFSKQGAAGDFIQLFLSGHGGRTNGNKTWFFLPFDFHPNNETGTTLTDKQILDVGDALVKQKKNVVIVIDACFSGQLQATAEPYLSRYKKAQDGGMILMLSSSAEQTSAALGNYSAFAKAFADAMTPSGDLNRDGKITLGEIKEYSSRRTAQLLAGARLTARQDSSVTWSPSFSKDTLLGATQKLQADPVKAPLTGKATQWAGTETLAGFGKLSFAMYPGGRAVMVDAANTTEGTWEKNDKQITLSFFNQAVVYIGTVNGATLSGTASSPAARMDARKTWNWTVQLQPAN